MKNVLTFGLGMVLAVSIATPALAFAAKAHAICKDGTTSYSIHRSGTCSWHHGVQKWLY